MVAASFDDLLLKFYELLTKIPEALSKYQRKFQYILIDEYRDTDPRSICYYRYWELSMKMFCVVGDDAQSIYSFQGSHIQNILQFRKTMKM